jgi:hypothetical protein
VADVVVYGGTAAGVVAAIEVVRRGKSVVVLNPGKHVGGLTTGGLGFTDFGKQHVVGGRARELYRAMGKKCGREELWLFAPSEAQAVLAEWMREHGIEVINRQYLERVERQGDRISAVVMMGGLRAMGKVFVDASYEGDLLARAGVSYTVGREGREVYGEQLAGIQVLAKHQFVPARVSAYVREGDASSGLLPGIESEDLTKQQGRGDKRVQAYNFRICMTDDPALKIDWEKPEKYDPMLYVLAERWFNGEKDVYNEQLTDTLPAAKKFDILENKTAGGFFKTDTNNQGPVSSDFIGANHEWPEACFERREELFQAHVNYQKGFYWMMANNPAIPERYRAAYRRWGLSRDEFVATGGWSPQLYVREARRLIGEYVVTEADCMGTRKCEDPVGMGSYALDSHNCCRFVNAEGMVMNEGDVQVPPPGPYGVSYRAMVPKAGECANLLVPVCVSTSHIAYGSVRMEPVFMILGQSAAVAACMAIDGGLPVQAVSYAKLRDELLKSGQVLVVA